LEITDKDSLELTINQIQHVLSKEFEDNGLFNVEVSQKNLEVITEILTPLGCFLLGRLTSLMDLHRELFGNSHIIPWIKNPERN
tara:strand:- start:1268 stop:1519 length:252 start_codon:yes stop_codon:yes gene_type:complete